MNDRDNFSLDELKVIRVMAARLAAMEGEDIIGAIMKVGGFRHLPADDGVVNLADKLEPTHQEMYPWRYTADWPARFYQLKYGEYRQTAEDFSEEVMSFDEWLVKLGKNMDVRYLTLEEKREWEKK